jgi:outer membrane biosynthesis protein TonB
MIPVTKYGSAVLAGALAFGMTACVIRAKQTAANAAPPAPLSTPQTKVTLPEPQPLDPYALETDEPSPQPSEPKAPPEVAKPAEQVAPPVVPPPPPKKAARTTSKQAPRKAPPEVAQASQTVPAEVAPPAAAEQRPPVQAIVSAEDQKKLKDSADGRKREVRAVVARIKGQRMSASDQDLVKRIESFLVQSDTAEKNGDMSRADDFAQLAQALARGWQGGR